jgi:transmembrane protein 222
VPIIGHLGIADSEGVTYDFAGPYHISVNHMAFGTATRYLQLDPSLCQGAPWDDAVGDACEVYRGRMHNLICDNCHSHVAVALERMQYADRAQWDMVSLALWMGVRGVYVSPLAVLQQWGPFAVWVALTIVLVHAT